MLMATQKKASTAISGDLAAAIEQVKEMQRSDATAKDQWHAYCDSHGNGVRDPSRHNVQFVMNFVTQYNQGHRIQAPQGGGVADLVKEGQRKSQNWKQAWTNYCQNYGHGLNDPNKHEVSFLVGFLDFLGQKCCMSMEMGGIGTMGTFSGMGGVSGAGMVHGPPAKRLRGPGGAVPAMGGSPGGMGMLGPGDAVKDKLISRIKNFQRGSEEQKLMWHSYCDTNLGGVRDPARHDKAVLDIFCNTNGVP